jgi:hypothetical protein
MHWFIFVHLKREVAVNDDRDTSAVLCHADDRQVGVPTMKSSCMMES